MSARALLFVVLYAVPATAVVAAVGAAALYALRRRSLRLLQVVAAAATVLAPLAGVVVVVEAMLINRHDFTVVMVVLVVAALAGVVAAWLLGRRIVAASGALADAAQVVGSGYRPPAGLPTELERVSRRLADTDERLIHARGRETALEVSRRDLVAWMSHDLRTPLAGIRAMAEALEDGVARDEDTMRRYHRQIREEVDRLTGMVDDLFELSRIHAGALQPRLQQVGLEDLVADAVATVSPVADAKGVRVVGEPASGVVLRVDPDGIGRVLRNLLGNAIRHTPSDGTVEVTAGVDGGVVSVAVTDSCGGIPEADLSHVFDVAFRGEAARTPVAEGGGGLGLAIAKGIVEAHAGDIGVVNTGPGCRFSVRLPLPA
ncbi:MAG: HAMP domain-containing histidine kinase [Streptosporangiales bacterium]|nr:HAMP domain-containing histidine kinase [Streptosporangiales bacterium]MBO0891067.1 HAMP domain-containing histidine kinase [Acidothermales bacterium]